MTSALKVEVDAALPNGVNHHMQKATVVCTLKIPNELLFQWSWQKYTALTDEKLIDKLNHRIKGEVVTIKPGSSALAQRLRKAIYCIKIKCRKCRGSRKQIETLQKVYHLFVLDGEIESGLALREQIVEAEESIQSWKQIAEEV